MNEMLFYVSGEYDAAFVEHLVDEDHAWLTSYAYPRSVKVRTALFADHLRASNKRGKHMIDSGAFTSWSLGKPVDLAAYCDTCNWLLDTFSDCMDFTFVALDQIPGQKGRETTDEDRRTACTTSAANYDFMRKRVRGTIKPVFHTGDPDWLLHHYADAEYIGFGMSQALAEKDRVKWVQQAQRKAAGKKLHGLAATGFSMLRAAPWHSVDSAAWLYAAAMGGIAWVRADGKLLTVSVSDQSPNLKQQDAHITTLPRMQQDAIAGDVAARGLTLEQLAGDWTARWRWNVYAYREACRRVNPAIDAPTQQGLFE